MPCRDCKYWSGEDRDYWDVPPGVRKCARAIPAWEATEWTKNEDGEDSYTDRVMREEADMKMFVMDGSQYTAALLTLPDFHCSEHQPVA